MTRDLERSQADHAERLRRLGLRVPPAPTVSLPGRHGIMLSTTGGWVSDSPGTVLDAATPSATLAMVSPVPTGHLIDERFHFACHIRWAFPKAVRITLTGPSVNTVWDETASPNVDLSADDRFLGWDGREGRYLPFSGMFRLYGDHGVDRYVIGGTQEYGEGSFSGFPLADAFIDPGLLAWNGSPRGGGWSLHVELLPDYFLPDPIPGELTIHKWSLHFGEDFGLPFQNYSVNGGPIFWDTVVFADSGLSLSSDQRAVALTVPGWYRYAASVSLSSIDGDQRTTRNAQMAEFDVTGDWTGHHSIPDAIPAGFDGTDYSEGSGFKTGMIYVPEGGGNVGLNVAPKGEVSVGDLATGRATSVHVESASLALYRYFNE